MKTDNRETKKPSLTYNEWKHVELMTRGCCGGKLSEWPVLVSAFEKVLGPIAREQLNLDTGRLRWIGQFIIAWHPKPEKTRSDAMSTTPKLAP